MASTRPGDVRSTASLLDRLRAVAAEQGLTLTSRGETLLGRNEAIRSKWFLGGRKMVYAMSCHVDEAGHRVLFREVEVLTSWGIPPPGFTVEKTTIQGSRIGGTRREVSLGGGGVLDYAATREAFERAIEAAGWTFVFEVGKMPEGAPRVGFSPSLGGGGLDSD